MTHIKYLFSTAKQIKEFKDMCNSGMTRYQLAEHYGISHRAICEKLREFGIELPKVITHIKITPEHRKKMIQAQRNKAVQKRHRTYISAYPNRTLQEKDKFIQMWNDGCSVSEIAAYFEISQPKVAHMCEKFKLQPRIGELDKLPITSEDSLYCDTEFLESFFGKKLIHNKEECP